MKLKKITLILLILSLSLSLCSCTSADYKLAEELYRDGDYEQALVFYESSIKYKDSAEKYNECKYYLAKMAMKDEAWEDALNYLLDLDYLDSEDLLTECYMHTNADYAVLDEIEDLITFRLYDAETQLVTESTLAKTEYNSLKAYEKTAFYDEDLSLIYRNLLQGVTLNYEAYQATKLAETQDDIYQAQYIISAALTELYEKYNFLKDDELFKEKYVDQVDANKEIALASTYIKTDLDEQLSYLSNTGTPFTKSGQYLKWTVKNNTEYTYTLKLTVSFVDNGGTSYYTETQSIKMAPGESETFTFKITNTDLFETLTFDYVYQDMF